MKRITIAALGLVVGATAGCKDMGLDGNIPLDEARDREPSALVAAVMRPTEAVALQLVVDGRLWLPSGLPLTVEAADLRPVGSAGGRTVHALRWDQSPHDALYIRLPPAAGAGPVSAAAQQKWQELRPVYGRSGRAHGAYDHGASDTASGHGASGHGASDHGDPAPPAGPIGPEAPPATDHGGH